MIIELKQDIFVKQEAFKALNHLIQLITYNERYGIFVDISKVRFYASYEKLNADDKDFLEQSYNAYILSSATPNLTVVARAKRSRENFGLEEAIRYLNQPVSILLENSLNDSYFINCLIKNFDNTGILNSHIENGWLEFINAGGCGNVANVIKGKLQSYTSLPKENHKYLRCFVLVDSDKEYPDEDMKHEYKSLKQFLDENGVIYHILEKRMMENYMPDEAFNDLINQYEDWVNAYLHLTPLQKDHINVSQGFPKNKNGEVISMAEQSDKFKEFYSGLSENNYNKLRKGLQFPHFKTDFPMKFIESRHLRKETLLKRTEHQNDPDELSQIVRKITQLV